MSAEPLAIIGGTGMYDLGEEAVSETFGTPYGDACFTRLSLAGETVIFLPRHGAGHQLPPHRINYRANIWALYALGVREIIATQAVGSLNTRMAPGSLALLAQFIDFTRCRPLTFFDGDDGQTIHADMTEPYCARLAGLIARASEFLDDSLHAGAVYACTEGPRFETAAEVRMLARLGADVVGMTSVPEVVLAREAGICFSAICVVCNWGAGMTNSPLTHREVLEIMRQRAGDLKTILTKVVQLRDESSTGACACRGLGFGDCLPKTSVV